MRIRKKKILTIFDSAIAAERKYQFQNAKKSYQKINILYPDSPEAEIARDRIEDLEALSSEKRIYRRIDRNAKRILTEIGIDFSNSSALMHLLMKSDAIDLESDSALFIPLKEDYLDYCLDQVPTDLEFDPGENAFGTGATPPFLLRPGRDDLAPADRTEFEAIVEKACEYTDSLGIFSLPVATDKSISDFECAKLMDRFSDLKMIHTSKMSDDEATFLSDREDWLDGTSLTTAFKIMPSMVDSFIRSVRLGNNLLLLDLTIAGSTGPMSPEALLTQVHAQVLFMMVVAQTINPGIACVHGGIPDVLGIGGNLSYSDPGQPLINSAMARLNMWITGFPTAQSGGSTSIIDDIPAAVLESELSRNTLREYGVHILRHAMGTLGSLNFFSQNKFIEDCKRERAARKIWLNLRHDFILPLHVPEDKKVVSGIREILEKGGPQNAEHTLNNVDAFINWRKKLISESDKKVYFPELLDTIRKEKDQFDRASRNERAGQLQETFFVNE